MMLHSDFLIKIYWGNWIGFHHPCVCDTVWLKIRRCNTNARLEVGGSLTQSIIINSFSLSKEVMLEVPTTKAKLIFWITRKHVKAIRFVTCICHTFHNFNICWHIPRLHILNFSIIIRDFDAWQRTKEHNNEFNDFEIWIYFWSCWPSPRVELCDNTVECYSSVELVFPICTTPPSSIPYTEYNLDSDRKKSFKNEGCGIFTL